MDIVYDGSCLPLKAQQIVSCHSHYLAAEVSLKSTSPANNLCRKIRGRAYRWVRTQEEARTSHGPCQLDRKAENTETLLAFPGLWDLARQRRSSRAPGPGRTGRPRTSHLRRSRAAGSCCRCGGCTSSSQPVHHRRWALGSREASAKRLWATTLSK